MSQHVTVALGPHAPQPWQDERRGGPSNKQKDPKDHAWEAAETAMQPGYATELWIHTWRLDGVIFMIGLQL